MQGKYLVSLTAVLGLCFALTGNAYGQDVGRAVTGGPTHYAPTSQPIDVMDYSTTGSISCPDGTTSCSIQDQDMGDVDNSSSAVGTQSNSSLSLIHI